LSCTKDLFTKLLPNGLIYIKIARENHYGWINKRKNYEGPEWGFTKEELRKFVGNMVIIHEDEDKDICRQILVKKRT
jgi:hypothetical protein